MPCGKCSHCKTKRREDWTIRLLEEMKDHDNAVFVTLTYADENIIYAEYLPTLYKPDLQNFIKRLRKRLGANKIRYYAVGEYGGKTIRPHYHLIIFGLSRKNIDIIQKAWSLDNKPIGLVHVGNVNIKTIKYVTKYHVNRNEYPDGVEPEFTVMSRKPAIGASYVTKMDKFHSGQIDRVFYQDYQHKKGLPRYYKDKMYTEEEKQQLFELHSNKDYLKEEREAWQKKHPNANWYNHMATKILNTEKLFKNKKRDNETI